MSAELPVKISFILLAGVAGSHESDGPCNQSQSNSTCQGAADVGDRRHIVALETPGALEGIWPSSASSADGDGDRTGQTVVNASAAVSVDRALHLAFLVPIDFFLSPQQDKAESLPQSHHHDNVSDRFSKRLQVIFSVQRHGTFAVAEGS